MKNKEIGVEYSRTVNILDFESLRLQASVKGDSEFEEGSDEYIEEWDDAWDEAKEQVKDRIDSEAIPILEEKIKTGKKGDERIKEMVKRRSKR
jgi:hypothetical protein